MSKFSIVPAWIQDEATPTAVLLYMRLARYTNRTTGRCWPAQRVLAEELRCSMRTVSRAMAELREMGAVRVHRAPGKVAAYEVQREPDLRQNGVGTYATHGVGLRHPWRRGYDTHGVTPIQYIEQEEMNKKKQHHDDARDVIEELGCQGVTCPERWVQEWGPDLCRGALALLRERGYHVENPAGWMRRLLVEGGVEPMAEGYQCPDCPESRFTTFLSPTWLEVHRQQMHAKEWAG